MAICKNKLKKFEAEHAEEIAATKAEFVKFLREGDLPEESMDIAALFVFIRLRTARKHNPRNVPFSAATFFSHVFEDGAYDLIEHMDNPENRERDFCPHCDGEGYVYKAAQPQPVKTVSRRTEKRAKSIGGVRGV